MTRRARLALLLAALLLPAFLAPSVPAGTSPPSKQGRTFRIACLQGGPWPDYTDTLAAMIEPLMELGWIRSAEVPDFSGQDTKAVWDWLGRVAGSDHLEFPGDGFLSADWNATRRETVREDLLARLNSGEFDLVLALGTWAGIDLANDRHHTPTMVLSTSNPIIAGIIPAPEDSGRPHLHVRNDPTRVQRQMRLFHDIIGFERLGLIYEDSDYGRAYAYYDEVVRAAEEGDFELTTCEAINGEGDATTERSLAEYASCVERLAPRVDAFVYDDHTGAKPEYVGRSLPAFIAHEVPTWSVRGAKLVERGVLLSIAGKDFSDLGVFLAETMARILNGTEPGDLPQVYRSRFRLAINLKTAELMGYKPPPNIIAVSDDVFTDITPPLEPGHVR